MIKRLKQSFDDYAHTIEGVEVWFARDLQKLLGYDKRQRFQCVIAKAEIACEQAGKNPADHLTGAGKMVEIGSETQREVKDYLLTRYASYLVAQNGDPRKKEIAFAMTYFAMQTRKMEVLQQRYGEKAKLSVPQGRPLADFLPRVTIAGKAFATELTNITISTGTGCWISIIDTDSKAGMNCL